LKKKTNKKNAFLLANILKDISSLVSMG